VWTGGVEVEEATHVLFAPTVSVEHEHVPSGLVHELDELLEPRLLQHDVIDSSPARAIARATTCNDSEIILDIVVVLTPEENG